MSGGARNSKYFSRVHLESALMVIFQNITTRVLIAGLRPFFIFKCYLII